MVLGTISTVNREQPFLNLLRKKSTKLKHMKCDLSTRPDNGTNSSYDIIEASIEANVIDLFKFGCSITVLKAL